MVASHLVPFHRHSIAVVLLCRTHRSLRLCRDLISADQICAVDCFEHKKRKEKRNGSTTRCQHFPQNIYAVGFASSPFVRLLFSYKTLDGGFSPFFGRCLIFYCSQPTTVILSFDFPIYSCHVHALHRYVYVERARTLASFEIKRMAGMKKKKIVRKQTAFIALGYIFYLAFGTMFLSLSRRPSTFQVCILFILAQRQQKVVNFYQRAFSVHLMEKARKIPATRTQKKTEMSRRLYTFECDTERQVCCQKWRRRGKA